MTPHDLIPGDVLLTYGSAGLWPPRRWVLWVVYRAIRAYQRKKWGDSVDCDPTHARLWLGNVFFEATWPKAKYTLFEETEIDKKRCKVVRWADGNLAIDSMLIAADPMIGAPYDWGDLLDMGIAAVAGIPQFRIFGDRMNKYRVCSTAAAQVLEAGGAMFDRPTNEIDPAYFLAKFRDWRVVYEKGQS
jgi:hypothetical protein